jgi:DNA-binding response OmpR family regulator
LVDDEPQVLKLLELILSQQGFMLTPDTPGSQPLRLLQSGATGRDHLEDSGRSLNGNWLAKLVLSPNENWPVV